MSPDDQVVARSQASERTLFRQGFTLVWRQLGRAKKGFAVGLGGTALYASMTVVSSLVIGWVTDSVLIPAVRSGEVRTATLAGAALAILGVSLARAIGITLRRAGAYAAQYRLQARDRTEVIDQYLRLPIEWHRRHPTGQLLSNVNADVEAASFIAAPLPMAVGVIVMLVVTAALLVRTDPFLALIGFLVGPLLGGANWLYQRKMRVIAAQAQRLRAEVSEIAHESFDAALVVKTLGRETAEVGRFGERSDELRDRMVEVGRIRAFFDPAMEALPNIGILLVLLVGARRVAAGAITPGDLITFAYLFRLVALPMRVFGWLLGELPRAVVGFERIMSVLSEDDRVAYGTSMLDGVGGAAAAGEQVAYRHPAVGRSDLGSAHAVRTDDGDTRGVDALDLDVPAGTTIAVVGPTGAGKSTIAHLLARLFDPDSGRITLDGTALEQLDRKALADSVALVFQEAFLFNDSVRNNITLDDDFTDDEVVQAATLAQADGFIRELSDGYDTLLGERGASLSGGQRQRIALARALIRHPRLLLLDDATSAVDPSVEGAILHGLSSLKTTVVIVAYRRSSIALADEVVFVHGGRAVARGTHAELYERSPAYRELVDAYDVEEAA